MLNNEFWEKISPKEWTMQKTAWMVNSKELIEVAKYWLSKIGLHKSVKCWSIKSTFESK